MTDLTRPIRQVIVTGATGFLGQYLVPELLKRRFDVVAIARDANRARQMEWYDRVCFVPIDLHALGATFTPEPGARLIHLAWSGLPNYRSAFHFEENLPYSYAFIRRLIEAGVQHVMVTGTCFEYGMQNGALAADCEPRPGTPYGFAKDALRRQLTFLRRDLPFHLQWARLFYMHGKGQHSRSILAQLDAAIDRGDASFDMSGGEQLRDYLHVGEVAKQLVDRLDDGNDGIFNVCSGQPRSIRRLVEAHIAARHASITMNLGHYPYPDYEPMAFWGVPDAGTSRL